MRSDARHPADPRQLRKEGIFSRFQPWGIEFVQLQTASFPMTADRRQRSSLWFVGSSFLRNVAQFVAKYVSRHGVQVLCNISIRVRVTR